ncbi:MAG: hypothetical protein KBS68_04910 [Clostridiales bacterium]|nr:hypothetical protein [Candidatus Crickella merdequi]
MEIIKIIDKQKLNDITFRFTMGNGGAAFDAPGQFARLYADGGKGSKLVPVAEFDSNRFIVILRVEDEVSECLAKCEPGTELGAELGLGCGFDIQSIPDGSTLAAEGAGIPTVLNLMRQLLIYGKDCKIVLGYSSKDNAFMLTPFKSLASNLEIITEDGSNGRKGHIDNAVRKADYVCACADGDIIRRLCDKTDAGQFICIDKIEENQNVITREQVMNM